MIIIFFFTLVQGWSRQQGLVMVVPCQGRWRRWTAEKDGVSVGDGYGDGGEGEGDGDGDGESEGDDDGEQLRRC